MKNTNQILKFAFLMYLGIGLFFLFMKLLGLEHITALRFTNVLIVAFFSVRMAKVHVVDEGNSDYLSGLFSIFIANILATVLAAGSLALYIQFIDPSLLKDLEKTTWFAGEITIGKVAGAILMEGAAAGMIVSFAVMQYFKDMKASKDIKSSKKVFKNQH